MPDKTALGRYLHMIKEQHRQIHEALVADADHYRDSRVFKRKWQPHDTPRDDVTLTCLRELRASNTLDESDKLFKEAVAQLTKAGLFEIAFPRLEAMKAWHQRLLEAAWEAWENERYYNHPNDSFQLAQIEHAKAFELLAPFEFAVEKASEQELTVPKPPMTDNQRSVYDLLKDLAPGHAMMGKEIIARLRKQHSIEIDQSTLTTRIIPFLREHYGVRNQAGTGYYIEKNT